MSHTPDDMHSLTGHRVLHVATRKRQGAGALFERLEDRRLLSAVLNVSPLQELPGVRFAADLGDFTIIAPRANLHATINWGDGTTSNALVKAEGIIGVDEIEFKLIGRHTYKAAGAYSIQAVAYKPGPIRKSPTVVANFNDSATVSRGNVPFDGTISGKYEMGAIPFVVIQGEPPITANYDLSGEGNTGALGAVSVQGQVTVFGLLGSGGTANGSLVLTGASATGTDTGTVRLQLTGISTLQLYGTTENSLQTFPGAFSYVISGGTGAFSGASGKGTITVKVGSTTDYSTAFAFFIRPSAS